MNCDQVKELLVEYLLNELSDDTHSAIDFHLRQGCSGCLAFEREIAEGIDLLLDAIPNDPLAPDRIASIHAAVINSSIPFQQYFQTSNRKKGRSQSSSLTRFLPGALAFAAGILVMMVVVPLRSKNELADRGDRTNKRPQSNTFAVDAKAITQDSEMSEEKYAKTLLVSMQRTKTTSVIEGHILWDGLSHEVHFFGNGLVIPPSGMHYVLWLIDENNRTLAAKELTVDSTGKCKATAASAIGIIRSIFITLESSVSSFDRPSGEVELTLDAKRFNAFPL